VRYWASLAPKVFAKQKRFSATPACFFQAAGSLNVDIGVLSAKYDELPDDWLKTGYEQLKK
jgi:hypothetical protein